MQPLISTYDSMTVSHKERDTVLYMVLFYCCICYQFHHNFCLVPWYFLWPLIGNLNFIQSGKFYKGLSVLNPVYLALIKPQKKVHDGDILVIRARVPLFHIGFEHIIELFFTGNI